jgi:isocitrate dehydrogenase (NAD+)
VLWGNYRLEFTLQGWNVFDWNQPRTVDPVTGKRKALYEPVHGSAPKNAKRNVINPTAAILSAGLMLEYLDMDAEANTLENAVRAVYREGKYLTYDQGGNTSTSDFAKAVLSQIR